MPRVLVPLAAGFEEIETSTIVDVLRRAGVHVVLAGVDGAGPAVGSRGIAFVADRALDAVLDEDFDLVVLPGGMGGTLRMRDHEGLKALLKRRVDQGQPVAAICAAPMVLGAAGVLSEGAFTSYPGVEDQIGVEGWRSERVVDAGLVVTSQGPGTAMDFALHLVGRLCGDAARNKVSAGLLHVS